MWTVANENGQGQAELKGKPKHGGPSHEQQLGPQLPAAASYAC